MDQDRCEGKQALLWRCRLMKHEGRLSYQLDLAERPEGAPATAIELSTPKAAWVSDRRSHRFCAISSVAGG
jgi:hypothetical protein